MFKVNKSYRFPILNRPHNQQKKMARKLGEIDLYVEIKKNKKCKIKQVQIVYSRQTLITFN